MGATCGCCASDDDTLKTKTIDTYIKKWHMDPSRITKFDKNDYELAKQEIGQRSYKGSKNMEILDEIARRQDL